DIRRLEDIDAVATIADGVAAGPTVDVAHVGGAFAVEAALPVDVAMAVDVIDTLALIGGKALPVRGSGRRALRIGGARRLGRAEAAARRLARALDGFAIAIGVRGRGVAVKAGALGIGQALHAYDPDSHVRDRRRVDIADPDR